METQNKANISETTTGILTNSNEDDRDSFITIKKQLFTDENYEQEKITGNAQQIVILDAAETGETDELDPLFNNPNTSDPGPEDPEDNEEIDKLDGDGIDEESQGIDPDETKVERDDTADLNHDDKDDLSLNTDDDDVIL